MFRTLRLNTISRLVSRASGLAAIVAVLAALVAPPAMAAESAPEVWINPGIYSYHFNRGKNLRDDNPGLGAEVALTEDHIILGGTYMNSNRKRTHYAGYEWRPLHWQPGGVKVGAGIIVGAFDGYPNYRDGGWFVAPLPVLSIEGRYLGVNLGIVPTIADRLDGALAIQVKLRVW